jgi:hypothetical protein
MRIFIILIFIPSLLLSQGSSRGASNLKLPFSPVVASTGEAFVANPGSSHSALTNPANISSVSSYQIVLSHMEWIQDIRSEYLSIVAPFHFGVFALAVGKTSIDEIELHGNIPGPALGSFTSQTAFLQLTYGAGITENLTFGISPKYIYEKIYIDETKGYGFDAGVLYKTSFENLVIGGSIINLGVLKAFRNEKIDLPASLRFGGTYSFYVNTLTIHTAASFWKELGISSTHFGIGLEAVHDSVIAVRLGYKTGYEINGFSAGIGIKYNIINLDYAYLPFSMNAGDAHIISIGFTL